MEEPANVGIVTVGGNELFNFGDVNVLSELNSSKIPPSKLNESSDDDEAPSHKFRRRVHNFSDSDTEKQIVTRANDTIRDTSSSETESNDRTFPLKSAAKSKILMDSSSSESEDISSTNVHILKNNEQQVRMKNKKTKLKQKFEALLSSRSKHTPSQILSDYDKPSSEDKSEVSDEASGNEISSIANIKQEIKKSMAAMPSICDPDTSDEESTINRKYQSKAGKKKIQRSTKVIEAKPMRMTSKQAIENMQLIKSESNRMLREKAVSLPYHRPKALSLKDIMSRRKPAVTSDGKVLPIKMNEEQLKEYALQLEQRQKEMMELCKSESDEDLTEPGLEEKAEDLVPTNSTNKDPKTNDNTDEGTTAEKTMNDDNTVVETNCNIEINLVQTDVAKYTLLEVNVSDTVCNEDQSEKTHDLPNSETTRNNFNTDIILINNDNSVEEENFPFNDSVNHIKEDGVTNKASEQVEVHEFGPQEQISINCSEEGSQIISLHYTDNDTEVSKEINIENVMQTNNLGSKTIKTSVQMQNCEKDKQDGFCSDDYVNMENINNLESNTNKTSKQIQKRDNDKQDDFFSDDDVNMEDIDKLIENAEIIKDNYENTKSSMLIKDPLTMKPKLVGTPGMVIDLDGTNAMPKRSGVELLKERFNYFSKLKTPEEQEREREKKLKPGALHMKLKYELEEKIAEQRSLEWAKRLEEEKQLHQEMDSILDNADEDEDDIKIMEANSKNDNDDKQSESETEEELIENDIEIKDKPRKYNPMLDDEAEESDIDEETRPTEADINEDVEEGHNNIEDNDSEESSEDDESSEEEASEDEEQTSKHKKGRILKAFEDSDEEDNITKTVEVESPSNDTPNQNNLELMDKADDGTDNTEVKPNSSDLQSSSQDDIIQLAQRHKSVSEDLFTSQESSTPSTIKKDLIPQIGDDLLGTQTFSISSANPSNFLCPSQPYQDSNLYAVSDTISQNVLDSQLITTQSSQSQPIGEDVLALCTGNFYDNVFVSSSDENKPTESQDLCENFNDQEPKSDINFENTKPLAIEVSPPNLKLPNGDLQKKDKISEKSSRNNNEDRQLLKSLIDELDDPEFDQPKPNKFFTGATQNKNDIVESNHTKKRLIIDSDDETNETNLIANQSKKKRKKKLEKRALQISDDEDDEVDDIENELGSEEDDYVSDMEENGDRIVEYDSEENEIEVKPDKLKKKRKATDFFEQEAELTSEDEWVGSGDEDEHGLDRMEREEGDDEVFHQGKLRKELGQIHMRDVLDQDKREVRLLQELLFEDGDLGDGHRQRKFRWRNAGDEETGTVPDEFTDTQEEEFESEEQWRKQRHEREIFLRQMQNQDEEEGNVSVTVDRTTIIKANLCSKSMSTLLMEVNQSKIEAKDSPAVVERKTVRDIPSPKKSFSILQQKYHNSVLSRGSSALARLAALATPLAAADDDAPKITSLASRKRNMVFTALSQDEDQPKVTMKRKAQGNMMGTPNLVKKIRLEEKKNYSKSSLLDHLNT